MQLQTAIENRRSCRAYRKTPVPEQAVHDMLQAAKRAPHGGEEPGFRFGVVRDEQLIRQLAQAAGAQMFIATAPLVFACCVLLSEDIAQAGPKDSKRFVGNLRYGSDFIDYLCRYPDAKARRTFYDSSVPLIAAEHICLTAAQYGLGTCYIGCLDIARAGEILRLPQNMICSYLLPVGYPAEPPKKKVLLDDEEFFFTDTYLPPGT